MVLMNPKGRINLNRSLIGDHHHGSITQLLLFLLLFSANATGQATHSGSKPAGDSSQFDRTTTIIVIIILVILFVALGFFSVYIRRCLERVMGINNVNSLGEGNLLSFSQEPENGLDASVIETFPTFRYSTVKTLRIGKEALECPVCLNEFEDDETLRLISKCCHVFHPGCIDTWLRSHATCPLCRVNLVPVPGESVVSIQIPGLDDDSPSSGPTGNHIRLSGSPDAGLIDSMALTCNNKSMPRRSISTGWNLAGIFTNSDWTGQDYDRFTLRLPQDIHNKLVSINLLKGQVVLPHVMSSTRGYRTKSLGTERNYFYYERFDQDRRLDRRPFSITPPYWTGSINSSPGRSGDEVRVGSRKGLLVAMRSPFNRLFLGKNNVGERPGSPMFLRC